MNTLRVQLIFTLALIGSAAACSQRGGAMGRAFPGAGEENIIRIHVTNLNFMDATLYALSTGTRERLGILTGKQEAVYTLPWRFSTQLRIEIDLLAGARCTTEALTVDPGDDIELIIDLNMNGSPLCRGR
jgi:hypothetical protein